MRGTIKSRTYGFLTQTLAVVTAACDGASGLDKEALGLLADASEKAAQWTRDTRALTRQDGTGIARRLISTLAKSAPISPLQEAILLQGMATEQFMLCDYKGATGNALRAAALVRPHG